MSEQGWRGTLVAHEGSDWVVLHGGATAVFRFASIAAAARLAEAIAPVPGIDGAGNRVCIAAWPDGAPGDVGDSTGGACQPVAPAGRRTGTSPIDPKEHP